MTYLLDTNVIVDLGNRRGTLLRSKLEAVGLATLAISAISLAELEYGEAKSDQPSRSLRTFRDFLRQITVVPFDEDATVAYGQIRSGLERKGQVIGANDMLIAATALAHNLILVTRDLDDFRRVDDLKVEDWSR